MIKDSGVGQIQESENEEFKFSFPRSFPGAGPWLSGVLHLCFLLQRLGSHSALPLLTAPFWGCLPPCYIDFPLSCALLEGKYSITNSLFLEGWETWKLESSYLYRGSRRGRAHPCLQLCCQHGRTNWHSGPRTPGQNITQPVVREKHMSWWWKPENRALSTAVSQQGSTSSSESFL